MLLEETTKISASPADVYHFFESMGANYERWHPDHITFHWLEGGGLALGSTAYFEERVDGKLQRKTVEFTDVKPNRYIAFKPTSRLVAILIPSISFTIDPIPTGSELSQRIKVRTGPIGAWLNRREFDAVRAHMREEGENLKRILEDELPATSEGAVRS